MRVLMIHNYYQLPGGEDTVFAAETGLLRARGQQVVKYVEHNRRIGENSCIAAAVQAVWSRSSLRRIHRILSEQSPDVAHFHNTFALVSPAAYYACCKAGVPVVQTLHNYRLICPAATLFRHDQACEECLGRSVAWPSLLHACYRNSRSQTAVVTAILALHGWLGTWRDKVDVYIAMNEFCKRKFVEGGLPERKIMIKPHFVSPDPGEREGEGDYALYVGRLTVEKGLRTLLAAWQDTGDIPLVILGDGPLLGEVQAAADRMRSGQVRVLGWRGREEVFRIMKAARFLVFPSRWPEPFGLAVIEAFACGLPVLASPTGALGDIVEDRRTGLHYAPENPHDLLEKAVWLWTHAAENRRMGREARLEFESKYTAESNYLRLLEIYRAAGAGGHGMKR